MRRRPGWTRWLAVSVIAICAVSAAGAAEQATKGEDGKYVSSDGTPTYHVAPDGTVDWYAYSGFRRYHSECHVCHGPDGLGSTYAPNLADSLKHMSYAEFQDVVVNGRKNVSSAQENVMPPFGENLNVMCYLDDIYVYLKARSDGAMGRGRPGKHEDKPKAATDNENTCFGRS